MAHVQFELSYDFAAAPDRVWDELVDWKGHEAWIPATQVELHGAADPAAVGAEFTAWSGIGRRLALEDRMRVDQLDYSPAEQRGSCKVTKLGPVLRGWAGFVVEPTSGGTQMVWTEDVTVPYAPQFLAPVLAKLGVAGFRLGMSRLAKLLANEDRA